jgi:predicted negative regulator of RcsB-dependent stress response
MADKAPTAVSDEQDRLQALAKWFRANERLVAAAAVALAIIVIGAYVMISAQKRKEAFAQRELAQARMSVDQGNLPLAASDLSRIIGSFDGTSAGAEARLLLAEVRLQQGQAALAATELQEFVDGNPDIEFSAQAYELLAVALEQTGQPGSAGQAFERGADAARAANYDYLAVNLLLNAARAFVAASDTTGAVRVLERVITDFEETTAASEARLRLAELGQYES